MIAFIRHRQTRLSVRSTLLAAVMGALCLSNAAEPSGKPAAGTFTDSRDGKTYKTVKIGRQTWMARNLDYRADSSWCYDNDASNCGKYGRLYEWETAIKVCHAGWHLPSFQEWDILIATVGGKETAGNKLKSKTGWHSSGSGMDDYGFTALPGGRRYHTDGSFYNAGYSGIWWTATEHSTDRAYIRYIYYFHDHIHDGNLVKGFGFSVRCVADAK